MSQGMSRTELMKTEYYPITMEFQIELQLCRTRRPVPVLINFVAYF